jgi:hypothetical protein
MYILWTTPHIVPHERNCTIVLFAFQNTSIKFYLNLKLNVSDFIDTNFLLHKSHLKYFEITI